MSLDFYEQLLENLHDGVYYVDTEKRITYWNRAAERITGYQKDEVMHFRCSDNILKHINEQGQDMCTIKCPLSQTLKDGKIRDVDIYLHHKEGYRVPVAVRVSPILNEKGKIVGAVELFLDNASKLATIKEIESLKQEVFIDQLTGLANRKFAQIELKHKLDNLFAYSIYFGVLFIDVDNFKAFNDTYGHNLGDKILIMVAKTMSNILRSMDIAVRWGGEEFVVIIPAIDHQNLAEIAERIRIFINKSWLKVEGNTLQVTVSIGGTIAQLEDSAKSLIERADQQMYKSKKAGKNKVFIDGIEFKKSK